MTTTYHVKGDHTLGYVNPAQPGLFWPLGRSVSGHAWQDGSVPADDLRPATLADFERFRVQPPPGWEPEIPYGPTGLDGY